MENKRYIKKFKESLIKDYSQKELGSGDFAIIIHDNKQLHSKCRISYYDKHGSGISIFHDGLFEIKRGNIMIVNGKNFIMIEYDKIKNIEYKKDGTYFIDIHLHNGLLATVDFL
jgi:hypothetical protein